MASDLSKYLGNKIVRWLAGQAMPTAPTALYAALFAGDPKASGTEVTSTIRSAGRVACTWSIPASNDTDNVLANSATVDFGSSETDVPGVTHFALYDASTSGKRIGSKALPSSVDIVTGQPVAFDTGDLTVTVGS